MAFYWTGGVSQPRRVRNIGLSGAYIETESDWYAGTVIHIVLERSPYSRPLPVENKPFGLWGRVVRAEPSGMAMEFLIDGREEAGELNRFLEANIEGFGTNVAAAS